MGEGRVAVGNLRQAPVMIQEGVVAEIDGTREPQLRPLRLRALELHGPGVRVDVLHALQFFQEVQVPHGAAELSIRDGFQAGSLLLGHQVGDCAVFRCRQSGAIDGSCGEIRARLFQRGGAQEASHDVVCIGRLLQCGHGVVLLFGVVFPGMHCATMPRYREVSEIYTKP